jgi:glycosidase
MLDFVPNHTGLDHLWVEDHPEYYIAGTELDLARAPQNYTRVKRMRGELLLAYGRDPYFAGWPDTLQLNYGNPAIQEAMIAELLRIGGQCDGVRCDMAMLVLPDVFERTWGQRAPLFWDVRDDEAEFCRSRRHGCNPRPTTYPTTPTRSADRSGSSGARTALNEHRLPSPAAWVGDRGAESRRSVSWESVSRS